MTRQVLYIATTVALIVTMPQMCFGQAPNLGTTSTFALFTAAGAFNNTGATTVTGDIGTNVGAFSGFPPGVVIGQIHVADPASAQAAADVATAYGALSAVTCMAVLGTTLGGGQVLTPSVYCLGAASTLNGDLILDAQGDPNALFIFKINGALMGGASAHVLLINAASWCNVYWQVNGEFALAANAVFRGTVIASGAIALQPGASLIGRGLSTAGAISTSDNVVTLDPCCNALPPTITCPPPVTVLCANLVPAPNINLVVATGMAPLTIVFMEDIVSNQSCTNQYSIVRSYRVTDACGHTANCTQSITVNDQTPPTVTCPIGVTVSCASLMPAVSLASVTTSDNCGGTATVAFVNDVISGQTCANRFTVTRTYRATDLCDNSSTCEQTITINDLTGPALVCPAVVSPIACPAVPVFPPATATDLCGANPTVSFVDVTTPGGICPQAYSVIRTWTAVDDCGNSAQCSRTITVTDTTGPALVCPAVVSPVICPAMPVFPAATATDLCDASPMISFVDLTTQINAQQTSVTRTWTAIDDCGNAAQCSRTIVVEGGNAPLTINCPISAPNLSADNNCQAVIPDYLALATTSGGCGAGPLPTLVQTPPAGTVVNPGTVIIHLTLINAAGQTVECVFNVTINGGCH